MEIPSVIGTALSKISISLLLLRILGQAANRMQKYLLYGINVFVVVYTIIIVISELTLCDPIAKTWNEELPGTCTREPYAQILYFQGGLFQRTPARVRDIAHPKQRPRPRLLYVSPFYLWPSLRICNYVHAIRLWFVYLWALESCKEHRHQYNTLVADRL